MVTQSKKQHQVKVVGLRKPVTRTAKIQVSFMEIGKQIIGDELEMKVTLNIKPTEAGFRPSKI